MELGELPMQFKGPDKPQSDQELVSFVEKVTRDVEAGIITTSDQVHKELEKLGAHYGPFGADFTELEMAIGKLNIACVGKGYKI